MSFDPTALRRAQADRRYARDRHAKAVSFISLPDWLRGNTGYNGRSYNQDSVCTAGGFLYAVWYQPSPVNLIIGKRPLTGPAPRWQTFDLSTIAGNPLIMPPVEDSHQVASLIVDDDGHIHIVANIHGGSLRYVRSTSPHDITAWTTPGMIGTEESQMSYPRFALHPDGDVFFLYRDGTSGNGDNYLLRYDGSTWTRVGKITQGKPTENFYENRFVIDRDGVLHISGCWRPGAGNSVNANNDLHYMRSADKGATWTAIDGTAVTMPLVHANTNALVLDTAATNSGLINQAGMDIDREGRPHIAMHLATGSTPDRNLAHIYWDGDEWVTEQITNFSNGMGFNSRPMRPFVVCSEQGRTYVGYSAPTFSQVSTGVAAPPEAGSFRLIDVTTPGRPLDFPVARLDGREAEMTVDQRALREHNVIRTLLHACNGEQTNPSPEYHNDNNWSYQWGGVLTVDLLLIGQVARRAAKLPEIRTVATAACPEDTEVSATSLAVVAGVPALLTPADVRGKRVFARLSVRGRTSASDKTLTVVVREVQQGGSSRNFGQMTFAATSTSVKITPWMPLRFGPINGADAFVDILASITSGGTGTLSAMTLEIGVLDGPIE